MKTSFVINFALAGIALAAPAPAQSGDVEPRFFGNIVGDALELAGGITSAAGAGTVGNALKSAGGFAKGVGLGGLIAKSVGAEAAEEAEEATEADVEETD